MDHMCRNVVVAGEETAKKFFAKICLDPLQYAELENILLSIMEPMFEIVYSANASALAEKMGNNMFRFRSEVLPFGVRLFINFSREDWTEDLQADKSDIILFATVFPYTNNENLFEPLEHITQYLHYSSFRQSRLHQFRVVFMRDSERKFGATDLVNEEEELRRAPQTIVNNLSSPVKELLDFKTYVTQADLAAVFSHNKKTDQFITAVCDAEYKTWKYHLEDFRRNFEDCYNIERESYSCLTAQEAIDDATHFESVKGSQDLWKKYCDNYISRHRKDLVDFVQRIYEEYLPCFCFWNRRKDFDKVAEEIEKEYYDTMNYDRKIPCPQMRADYSKLLAEKKIDTEFTGRLYLFFEKNIPDYLENILKEKEGILAGYCTVSD